MGVGLGAYCHVSDSLHAYERDRKNILAASTVTSPEDTSSLALLFADSEKVFQALAQSVGRVIDPENFRDAMDDLEAMLNYAMEELDRMINNGAAG